MRRRKSAIFFLVLGICLVALAVALNIGWILLNLQQIAMLVLGIVFFALIITGIILNMIFLVREIRKNEQQDAFLNAVTHELKTPIASIKLYLETLKTRDVKEERRAEFYDVMLADSDRLLTTVEQVLYASKTREKGRDLNIERINLRSLLEECAGLLISRYHLDSDAVAFSSPEEDIFISAERAEMQTAFSNLLDNAVKYSDGLPEIRISTNLRRASKSVEIEFSDSGIGMPDSELKAIFKRFYRIQDPSTEQVKGTGLGLFIVKSILEKHGGRIKAASEGLGKGSTFVVELPIVK